MRAPKAWGRGVYADQHYTYVTNILKGKIPANEFTRLACEREMRDMENPPRGAGGESYRFSPWRGDHMCRFFEALKKPGGVGGGRLRLLDYQCFVLRTICGWVYDSSFEGQPIVVRRYRKAYLSVARKNAKTSICASLGLYMLIAECLDEEGLIHEEEPQILVAAANGTQAGICRDLALGMLTDRHCKAWNVAKFTRTIKARGGFFEARNCTSASLEGTSPSLGVVDELHLHPDDKPTRDLRGGMGARKQPLLFEITTAGEDINSYCYEREQAMKLILQQKAAEPMEDTFALIYGLEKRDDPLDRKTWRKANPSLIPAGKEDTVNGVCPERDILSDAADAALSSRTLVSFRAKRTNIWTSGVDAFFDINLLQDCAVEGFDFDNLAGGGDVYIGADYASTNDLGAVAAMRLDMSSEDFHPKKIEFAARVFVPEGRILAGGAYGQMLQTFVDEGKDIEVTAGDTNDFERMQEFITELIGKLPVKGIGLDKWQSAAFLQQLHLRYNSIDSQEVGQGAMEQNDALQALEQRHRDGGLVFSGSKVLLWMFGNAVARTRAQGEKELFKLDKLTDKAKIDAVSALVTGMYLGMKIIREQGSVLGVSVEDLQEILRG